MADSHTHRKRHVFRWITLLLLLIFSGTFLYSGYRLFEILQRNHEANATYDSIAQSVVVRLDDTDGTVPVSEIPLKEPAESPEGQKAETSASENIETEESVSESPETEVPVVLPAADFSPVTVDFEELRSVSSEVVAWLYSPNGTINYPVAQHSDDLYYLNYLPDGTPNANGTLFVQSDCPGDFSGQNTVIHGHHMNNGAMFGTLAGYSDQDYYEQYPVMYLNTPAQNYRIEFFAGFDTMPLSEVYTLSFGTDDDFLSWVERCRFNSLFRSDVEVSADDLVVTLSTCNYTFDDARFVLIGKLVKIG